ncbi:MAG: hypothetical protein ABSB70_18985, partial [Candidatus Velthaea sp.]
MIHPLPERIDHLFRPRIATVLGRWHRARADDAKNALRLLREADSFAEHKTLLGKRPRRRKAAVVGLAHTDD